MVIFIYKECVIIVLEKVKVKGGSLFGVRIERKYLIGKVGVFLN